METMSKIYHLLVPFIVAFCATLWVHPKILKIAILKNLVDNPDERKLQRRPVPVMGGLAVFFGITVGICSSQITFFSPGVFVLMAAMIIMLYTGTIDDILDLTPRTRFIIEIAVVAFIILVNNSGINHFWGLWGIDFIPAWIAGPLTIFAAVGIINAINLIDGVNGLSSGFCFMASVMFAIMLYMSGNTVMTILAVSAAGAIIPFFLHNVFGNTTKMFIGDGGTLVIGTMMSMFVVSILKGTSLSADFAKEGVGLIPFTLAVLAVPVFDTLRVMSMRIIRKKSPFHPDKTHLHHLFLELGFSHIGTTVSILTLNFLIIVAWFVSYKLGASIDTQLYVVLSLSILITFVFYKFAQVQIRHNTKILRLLQGIGSLLQIEKRGIWAWAQRLIDKL
ncbi:MAG: undecaprenyl/decaprenyl-phosphate alpha-N-acetylglucosaminyl 1-phosphate transferase [Bacteroidaceae bacterium]|nr:undecaprenyl/decaprenyl-phosphate alpha-N-acetylglucosaminyl 1-phosphate transferase [Bacteroidaceae bacterium]